MRADTLSEKTPATLEEIWTRVYYALARHRLCRNIVFDVVTSTRNPRGGNWNVRMTSVGPDSIRVASDIIADIQAAYDLVADAEFDHERVAA